MDRVVLENKVNAYLDEISKPFQFDPGYEYLKQITCTNNLNSISGFLKSDIFEIYKGIFYLVKEGEIPIEQISDIVDSYRPLLEDASVPDLSFFQALFDAIVDLDIVDLTIEYLQEKNFFRLKVLEMKDLDSSITSSLNYVKEEFSEYIPDFVNCLMKTKEFPDSRAIFDFVSVYHTLKNTAEGIEFAENIVKAIKGKNVKINKKMSSLSVQCSEEYDFIMKGMKMILDFVMSQEQEAKQIEKKKNSEYYSLKNSLVMLNNAVKKEEITNAREIVKGIRNYEIKYSFLEFIHEFNQRYYEKLNKKYDELSSQSSTSYTHLLHNYEINVDGFDVSGIMHNSLEQVEDMIKELRRRNLSSTIILYILSVTSFDKFTIIFGYLIKQLISIEYLKANLDVFRNDNNDFEFYINNVKTLDDNDVNPQMFLSSCYMLFDKTGNFKKNIEILRDYNLLKYLKTTNCYDFLVMDGLASKIDMLIDFGYIGFLKENIGLLNYSSYKRLCVLKEMGMMIESQDELIQVLDSSKRFIVPDNQIGDYLSDFVEYKKDNITFDDVNLEEYRDTSRSYSIDGVIVSSERVSRNISSGMSIYDAIFEGMYATQDDYETICNSLGNYSK